MKKLFYLLLLIIGLLSSSFSAPEVPSVRTDTVFAKEKVVYVTKTGKRYHLSNCHHLRSSKIKLSLSRAKQLGYLPCKHCKP